MDPWAQDGVDYVASRGTVTIPAGQTTATFTIPILNDPAADGNEDVKLQLSNPVNAILPLGPPSQALLVIQDNSASGTVYTTNSKGQIKSETFPDGSSRSWTYDPVTGRGTPPSSPTGATACC